LTLELFSCEEAVDQVVASEDIRIAVSVAATHKLALHATWRALE
jgi:hypothetical protein